ncbi:hypothetical protein BY996DRAFT_6482956 [Phakopsora pachyrhizi]|nr:hypothetical protein BY996DRAFT_6482956 [Phakopsora pachyrhizi]
MSSKKTKQFNQTTEQEILVRDGSENEDLRHGPYRGPNDVGDWTLMEDQELERLYSGKSNKAAFRWSLI